LECVHFHILQANYLPGTGDDDLSVTSITGEIGVLILRLKKMKINPTMHTNPAKKIPTYNP
jgi:hypothetical protein